MINTIYWESPILFKDKKKALEFKKILIWETLGKQKHCKWKWNRLRNSNKWDKRKLRVH